MMEALDRKSFMVEDRRDLRGALDGVRRWTMS
jgi:hypothetical protein